jgi:hypothetical protein
MNKIVNTYNVSGLKSCIIIQNNSAPKAMFQSMHISHDCLTKHKVSTVKVTATPACQQHLVACSATTATALQMHSHWRQDHHPDLKGSICRPAARQAGSGKAASSCSAAERHVMPLGMLLLVCTVVIVAPRTRRLQLFLPLQLMASAVFWLIALLHLHNKIVNLQMFQVVRIAHNAEPCEAAMSAVKLPGPPATACAGQMAFAPPREGLLKPPTASTKTHGSSAYLQVGVVLL